MNLQIESIEPSLIALSRAQAHLQAACQEACLIIQLDEDVAELGICHRGRLLLDYRPGGHTNADNVADVVAQHLSRLQRYMERYHSYLDVAADRRLPGRRSRRGGPRSEEICQAARLPGPRAGAGRLEMQWQHTNGPPGTDLAAALGTAMALYPESGRKQQGPNLIANTLAQLRAPMRPDSDSQLDAGGRRAA